MSCWVYCLELENKKYYVGKSTNVLRRIEEHILARDDPSLWMKPTRNRPNGYPVGSKWTRKHVIKQILNIEAGG